jgi:abequosyltransferase
MIKNTKRYSLDLLIPTYNRAYVLEKNLELVFNILSSLEIQKVVRVIISDNASTDNTWSILKKFKDRWGDSILLHRNLTNIGLQANIIKTLELSSSPYVMFLGDDDFIPIDYWKTVMQILCSSELVGVIIPKRQTITAEMTDEAIENCLTTMHKTNFSHHPSGWFSAWQLASDCNQLSGIVYNRESLLDYWLEQKCSSIYPFMCFAGWSALKNVSYRALNTPILVTEGTRKDWGYGKDGLLGDILVNAQYIAKNNKLQRMLGEIFLLWKWRDRIAMNWVRGNKEGQQCETSLNQDERLLLTTRILLIPLSRILKTKISLWRATGRLQSPHIKT